MNNLISIITPTYNAERFIAQTAQSVFNQTYPHWELLIVVDSQSKDQTATIAAELTKKDTRVRVISNSECRGVANNRNIGIREAHGEYIAFLDADDLWHPDKLQTQLQFMAKNQALISCHAYQPVSEDNLKNLKIRKVPFIATSADLLRNNTVGCLTVMIKKEALPSPAFIEGPHEDLVLWLRISKSHVIYGLNQNLASYRVVEGSRSNNKFLAAKWRWQVLREFNGGSIISSAWLFTQYGFHSLSKRWGKS